MERRRKRANENTPPGSLPGGQVRVMSLLLSVLATLTLTLTPAPPVQAATWTVCAGGCDYTTIAAAIAAASANDTITVTDAVRTEANITVSKNLTIQGQGAASTIVQAAATPGSGGGRVFLLASGVTATIQDMTIRNGDCVCEGGGIYNNGMLTVSNSTFSGNSASTGGLSGVS